MNSNSDSNNKSENPVSVDDWLKEDNQQENQQSQKELQKITQNDLKKKPEDDENQSDDSSGDSDNSSSDDEENEPRFIKKDEIKEEKTEEKQETKNNRDKAFANLKNDLSSAVDKLKDIIFPRKNQLRSLDKEVGGLEASKDEGLSSKDAWDARSEEVDQMGSTNTFNTTGMKSVVWKQKKDRIKKKKEAKQEAQEAIDGAKKAQAKNKKLNNKNQQQEGGFTGQYNSANNSFGNQSYVEKINNFHHEKDHDSGGHGDGGAWR